MADTNTPEPTKGRKLSTVLLVGVCGVAAVVAGAVVPYFLFTKKNKDEEAELLEARNKADGKKAYVVFGDVVVNLNEERLTRYLRVKLVLVVDASLQEQLRELVEKNKPFLRNWLITHLSDKSLAEVRSASGVNRIRREIWYQFNAELFPDGSEFIRDVFFEEFVVQ